MCVRLNPRLERTEDSPLIFSRIETECYRFCSGAAEQTGEEEIQDVSVVPRVTRGGAVGPVCLIRDARDLADTVVINPLCVVSVCRDQSETTEEERARGDGSPSVNGVCWGVGAETPT